MSPAGAPQGQTAAGGRAAAAGHAAARLTGHGRSARAGWTEVRPLDPLQSLKVKLGVLVAVTVTVSSLLVWAGLHNQIGPRYTLPAAIVAALVVTQLLARGMTSPLREMTAAARAMATGDYSRRVRSTSHDEVGELAVAFNRMAEDLEAVDRERRELVANVSHELRTPVSALRAVLENVVDGVTQPEPQVLSTALAQTERLGRLVEQLLDLSRVDAGKTALVRDDVALRPFLQEAVDAMSLAGRGVDFVVDVEPPGIVLSADAERLHQVVANLLDNASRHSPEGGTVTVSGRLLGDVVRISVSDEGPGIADADRERVFERFHRGTSRPDGGTGLGLAIARWAVQLHGGSIAVAAQPDGAGCRIDVHLPLHAPQAAAGPVRAAGV
ncbi:phospho-acceptor domain-containing protein [Kineococcus xinjiangensis]|uniref:histidine kinase n=1 Tax=Kineococcus xinjiangensis TaxID=512762 RepID=A0A2S6IWI9_9ACTN|nr:ATP-binding protein [Kineococcus xinjiangensis]PPK98708.1 phospho-acceptor domain-containing protein [Kineococcus xinjiangensis]